MGGNGGVGEVVIGGDGVQVTEGVRVGVEEPVGVDEVVGERDDDLDGVKVREVVRVGVREGEGDGVKEEVRLMVEVVLGVLLALGS